MPKKPEPQGTKIEVDDGIIKFLRSTGRLEVISAPSPAPDAVDAARSLRRENAARVRRAGVFGRR
jgi:hypothetical protein